MLYAVHVPSSSTELLITASFLLLSRSRSLSRPHTPISATAGGSEKSQFDPLYALIQQMNSVSSLAGGSMMDLPYDEDFIPEEDKM